MSAWVGLLSALDCWRGRARGKTDGSDAGSKGQKKDAVEGHRDGLGRLVTQSVSQQDANQQNAMRCDAMRLRCDRGLRREKEN